MAGELNGCGIVRAECFVFRFNKIRAKSTAQRNFLFLSLDDLMLCVRPLIELKT